MDQYWTHYCWAHGKEHHHTEWYFRKSEKAGDEFICANEYDGMPMNFKAQWERYHQ